MDITISGASRSIDLVSVVMKRFGEAPASPHGLPYVLSIDRDQVQRDFQQYYDDYIEDAKAFGIEDNNALERSLDGLQFPAWQALLDKEPGTASSFLLQVAYDFLNTVLLHVDDAKTTHPFYFIQTVDRVEVDGDVVNLAGLLLDYRRAVLDRLDAALPGSEPCDEPRYGFNSGYWDNED